MIKQSKYIRSFLLCKKNYNIFGLCYRHTSSRSGNFQAEKIPKHSKIFNLELLSKLILFSLSISSESLPVNTILSTHTMRITISPPRWMFKKYSVIWLTSVVSLLFIILLRDSNHARGHWFRPYNTLLRLHNIPSFSFVWNLGGISTNPYFSRNAFLTSSWWSGRLWIVTGAKSLCSLHHMFVSSSYKSGFESINTFHRLWTWQRTTTYPSQSSGFLILPQETEYCYFLVHIYHRRLPFSTLGTWVLQRCLSESQLPEGLWWRLGIASIASYRIYVWIWDASYNLWTLFHNAIENSWRLISSLACWDKLSVVISSIHVSSCCSWFRHLG